MTEYTDVNQTPVNEREQKSIEDGVQRYRTAQERLSLPEKDVGKRLLNETVLTLTNALAKYIADVKAQKGRPATWLVDFEEPMELGQVAQLTIMAAMDGHVKLWSRASLINNIGKQFACLRFETLMMASAVRDAKRVAKNMGAKVDDMRGSGQEKVDYYWKLAEKEGFTWDYYTDDKMRAIGAVCVSVLQDACGDIFVPEYRKDDEDTDHEQLYLVLSEQAQQNMTALMAELETTSPMYAPMDRRPRPWSLSSIGPYQTPSLAASCDLVRHASPAQKRDVKEAMINGQMADPILALNSLQEVPYEVNAYVVDAVRYVSEAGISRKVSSFPEIEQAAVPNKLAANDYDKQTPLNKKLLAEKRTKIIAQNAQARADAKQLKRNLAEADYWIENGPFYMPHNFDTRGRIYHISDFGHHNTDYLRGMLLFHNKEPVTEDCVQYLALQLANAWGGEVEFEGEKVKTDKLPLSARKQWVEDNIQQIVECGKDFKSTFDFWSEAAEPFTFLAGCHELANYFEHGEGYLSGLPVGLDATSSGIQHYAAASLNYQDGHLSNLTNNERPEDMYLKCLEFTQENMRIDLDAMKLDAANDNDSDENSKLNKHIHAATLFLDEEGEHRLKREHLKANCMTWCYSSRRFGFAKQIRKKIMDPLTRAANREANAKHPFGDDNGFAASHYLAGINEKSIAEAISSAAAGMEFFQKCANALSAEGKHLKFVSPIGFPMHQYYRNWKKNKQKVPLYNVEAKKIKSGQDLYFRDHEDTVKQDKSKNAVAANMVHCLDATHLMMTVLKARRELGITDIMVVHDSFSTTIAGTKALSWAIRQAFIDLYDGYCVYQDLLDQVIAQLDNPEEADLPSIPPKGEGSNRLNLSEVLLSDYCFS